MTSMFMQMFSVKRSLDKLREYGFSLTRILPYKGRICDYVLIRWNTGQWNRILEFFMQCISQTIILTQIYHILCSNWDVTSNQIINLRSSPEIQALQIRRLITTSTISKLSFMNADTHIIFLK